MLNFNFYKAFAKKENSTKIPGSGALTLGVQGIFKEPCSVLNPVLKIERLALDASPYDYTYAKYIDANKYYFVEDWVWADGLWEVHLKEDVLATFKTEIGLQSEYVLRTDSTLNFNGEITDTAYPATTDVVTSVTDMHNIFSTHISVGCYIVGIISGNSTNAVGAISYYAMSSGEFGALKNKLFSSDNLEIMGIINNAGVTIVDDLSQEVLKTLYNPYQYIASCMWFPFGKDALTESYSVTGIKIGWWNYPTLSGNLLYAQRVEIAGETYGITAHPQASRGSYLNYAPYTKITLLGRFGTVPIDTTIFQVNDEIYLSYIIDLITGQCYVKISRKRSSNYLVFAERNFLLGVPIQIAQVGTDYLGTAINIMDTAPKLINGAITGFGTGGVGGAIAGAITGSATGIYNTLQSAMPQVETGGQNGSFLSADNHIRVIVQHYKIVDEDINHKGRPLCEIRQINTLSGYILCAEGDIDISCFDNEREMIKNYLTTGFFFE